jgi:hypothetical protein
MKKLLLLIFAILSIGFNSCDCMCDGNDYSGDDYEVIVLEKWSDIGPNQYSSSTTETRYFMKFRFRNISDSTYIGWIQKMMRVSPFTYHTYDVGHPIKLLNGAGEEKLELSNTYRRFAEEAEKKRLENEEKEKQYKKRVI